jgi:hypothetical protein
MFSRIQNPEINSEVSGIAEVCYFESVNAQRTKHSEPRERSVSTSCSIGARGRRGRVDEHRAYTVSLARVQLMSVAFAQVDNSAAFWRRTFGSHAGNVLYVRVNIKFEHSKN